MATDILTMIWNLFQSTFTGNDALSNTASIVTIATLGIAPVAFLVKRWFNIKSERSELSKNLHAELQDALHALDGTDKRQIMEIEVNSVKKYYTLTFMNHDIYDSLVFSGRINSLNHGIQQDIQNVFRMIKGHKEYLKLIMQLNDIAAINDKNILNTTGPYYDILDKYEYALLDRIPTLLKKLEKNF